MTRKRFRQYKTLGPLRRRVAYLSAICRKADEATRTAREELWCLYAQEQLLESKDLRWKRTG